MSSHFYNFIAQQLLEFFAHRGLTPGDKFHVQFEGEPQVAELYSTMKTLPGVLDFTYEGVYKTICFKFGGVRLIVAATVGKIKPDFLTHLRNKVGTMDEQFYDTAILFIHNSTLDSIVGGTQGLDKPGMPLNRTTVVNKIYDAINSSTLKFHDKQVLKFVMTKKKSDVFDDNVSSLLEYVDVIAVISDAREILPKDYKNFGLFYDSALLSTNDEKQIELRLSENSDFFEKIDNIHKYQDPSRELEKMFDHNGIKALGDPDIWQSTEYKDVKTFSNNYKQSKLPIEYLEEEKKKQSLEGITYWERKDGSGKAGSRIRHILVFNVEKLEQINLEFSFSDFLRSQDINPKSQYQAVVKPSGKKLRVTINHTVGCTTFSVAKYEPNSLKFEFRIAVVECEESVLKAIKAKYTIKSKKPDKIVLNLDDDRLVINPNGTQVTEDEIHAYSSSVELSSFEQKLVLTKNILTNTDDDSEYVEVLLKYNESVIPLGIADESVKPTTLTGMAVWQLKRTNRENFLYLGDNKIIQGTEEHFATKEFRKNIEREQAIIQDLGLHHMESFGGTLEPVNLEVHESIEASYLALAGYYRDNNLIPSLTFMNDDVRTLSRQYVQTFITVLSKLQENKALLSHEKNLIKIGTIEKTYDDQEILLSPLHPLNVAYQLLVNDALKQEELPTETLKRLNPLNLFPYLFNKDKKLYRTVEQTHSPEWSYYVSQDLPRYKGSRNFVSKLVREKIEEFIEHFSYLFVSSNSPFKINLINMGDCREVLQGIFEYYVRRLNKGERKEEILPLEVCIYSHDNVDTVFEDISMYDDPVEVENDFGVNLQSQSDVYTSEDLLNIVREKVHFNVKDYRDEEYEYCHIAFFELNAATTTSTFKMHDINNGVSLQGLISGLPSVYTEGAYRTGFGSQYLNGEPNLLVELAMRLNALAQPSRTPSLFKSDECVITAIEDVNKDFNNKVYSSSHWVTFVDPKVDLSFFKNDIDKQELLIIHYSDQYSSSGYDAITVTRRSQQYQNIIVEFLNEKGIHKAKEHSFNIINLFNAVNGDWLLRLISKKGYFPKEKLSILSAVKLSLAYLANPNIVWVPLSLEEVIRVSSGAGLPKKDGLFSIHNLGGTGKYSDDLLLIGIEVCAESVFVHFYPIEVKIGINHGSKINTAKEQASKTHSLLREMLLQKTAVSEIYRNFFMQMAIVSAEKMRLYNVWNDCEWSLVTDSIVRGKLLSEDYQIVDNLHDIIGDYGVVSFKSGIHFNTAKVHDNVLLMELSEQDGFAYTAQDIEDLKDRILNGQTDFRTEDLLAVKYSGIGNSYQATTEDPFVEGTTEEGTTEEGTTEEGTTEEGTTEEGTTEEGTTEEAPLEIVFGHTRSGSPVLWYPTRTDKVFHTNTGIIGTMGTGKTQFTKSLITQLNLGHNANVNGTKIGILIFDYNQDYVTEDFVNLNGAKKYGLLHLPFNPLSLYVNESSIDFLPLHTANSFTETLSTAFNLGPKQQRVLRNVIMKAYEEKGIDRADRDTWELAAPTLSDVYRIYLEDNADSNDSLTAALDSLCEFEIFEPDAEKTQPLFELLDGATVIDVGKRDESIQNLVVAITLDVFYNQMQAAGHSTSKGQTREITRMILVDEADNFLSKDFKSLRKILKEGRKYGVGTILSTQFLNHFSTSENDYANYILTWIIHNVPDVSAKDIRSIFNTSSKPEEENIMNQIRQLGEHCSIVSFGSKNPPIQMQDLPFYELAQKLNQRN